MNQNEDGIPAGFTLEGKKVYIDFLSFRNPFVPQVPSGKTFGFRILQTLMAEQQTREGLRETLLPVHATHRLSDFETNAQRRAQVLVHELFEDHPTSTAPCVFGPRNILDQPLYLAAVTTRFHGGLSSYTGTLRDAQMRELRRFLKQSRQDPQFRFRILDLKTNR